jgi:UDP-glucose-4-epimerase GalE
VVHLAAKIDVAESVRDPIGYYRANVMGGLALFESAIAAKVKRFVFSSSASVYGDPALVPVTEEQPLAPMSPYGEGKRVLERALESYARAYGVSWVSLRYFNAAGASPDERLGENHDPETHLVPLAVGAALGARPPLVIYGDDHPTKDGTCIRDYVHVRDLADAHVLAVAHLEKGGASTAINLGTGVGASVREVIAAVERATKKKVPHSVGGRRPGDPAVLVASNERARGLLGWKPTHDLDAIVRDVALYQGQTTALPK